MANYIEVNIRTLENDANRMNDALNNVKKDMKDVFSIVNELSSMWKGPANTAFVQQVSLDSQILDEVAQEVNGVIDSMENAVKLYRTCENEVESEINSINI